MAQNNMTPDYKSAAMYWFGFGFSVIPIIPGTKQSATKWDTWLDGLSTRRINLHWEKHPDHEVGLIVGDDLIVFDADSLESIAALAKLEKTFDAPPALTVTTAKGVHHYFKRPPDTYAKSDSHSTEEHPERIDVKTGRALVVLPPSTGKGVDIEEAEDIGQLTVVSQAFIDAVFIHNDREAPRQPAAKIFSPITLPSDMPQAIARLNAMLQHVDPDVGYEDWLHTLMAIYHETGGSDEGLAVAIAWSSKGSKFRSEDEIKAKWHSFTGYTGTPVTIGTIRSMLAEKGIDWIDICDAVEPQFTPCEFTVVYQQDPSPARPAGSGFLLDSYSLRGMLPQLEREAVEQVPILGVLALLGQITIFYAAPNTGKTLLTLWLLIQAIKSGKIDPTKIYYINVDDSLSGLIMKLRLAVKYGFHMVAEGHCGFRASDLLFILIRLMDSGQCKGVVIILDTLKKFTDIMNKRESTTFSKVIRRFIMQGGTCIALAHTNKNLGRDGKPIYAGTSDTLEDADCAYTLQVISDPDAHEKVVEFENIKRRGDVCQSATYCYSNVHGIPYGDLLRSVRLADDAELLRLQQAEEVRSDTEQVEVVIACLREGINTKMILAEAVSTRIGCSKRATIELIEKYTGTDPAVHRWTFDVGERGAKVYRLLDPDTPPDSPEDTDY